MRAQQLDLRCQGSKRACHKACAHGFYARPSRCSSRAPCLLQAVCLVPELPLQLLAGAGERVAVGHQEVALLQQHIPQLVQIVPGLDAQVARLPRAACAACAACLLSACYAGRTPVLPQVKGTRPREQEGLLVNCRLPNIWRVEPVTAYSEDTAPNKHTFCRGRRKCSMMPFSGGLASGEFLPPCNRYNGQILPKAESQSFRDILLIHVHLGRIHFAAYCCEGDE